MSGEDHDYLPPVEDFEGALADLPEDGAMAVVSDQWGGRDALLDHAEEYLDQRAERTAIESALKPSESFPAVDELAFIEDCHLLFRREIGGFDALERFISSVVRGEGRVITTWNAIAWVYLTRTLGIDDAFDAVHTVSRLDREQAAALLAETKGVEDPEESLDTDRSETPPPVADDGLLTRLRWRFRRQYRGTVVKTELEGLVDDARGNPLAIQRVYEARTTDGIETPLSGFDLDYDESYLLWLVAANESVSTDVLENLTWSDPARMLSKLERQGAIRLEDDTATIAPVAFGTVLNHLERRRLVW